MSTEKSNGGPFVTFREECEILRARVVELEEQLDTHKKLSEAAISDNARWVETLTKKLMLAKEALASASTFGGFVNAVAQKALAAINDSKMVEGMILCDAKPIGEIEAIDVDEDAQPSAWIRINTDVELGDQLYAPRRTE